MFTHFDILHKRDRRTNRQMDRHHTNGTGHVMHSVLWQKFKLLIFSPKQQESHEILQSNTQIAIVIQNSIYVYISRNSQAIPA